MPEVTLDRLPPHNKDAEQSVLGSMLRDNDCIAEVSLLVSAQSFYCDHHRKIFQAIVDLHGAGGKPVDLVLLGEELIRRGQLEDVSRAAYLGELWDAAPTAANVAYYARIVRDKAILRSLIHTATEVLRDAYEQNQPADDVLGQAEQKILAVSQLGAEGQTCTLGSSLGEVSRRLDERCQQARGLSGLSTGFTDLDSLTAGWQAENLYVLGARPSVGKTALALVLLHHIAKHGDAVFFASLEQSRYELGERLLSMEAAVNGHAMRRGLLDAEQMDRLAAAMQKLHDLPLHIDDSARQTMLRIAANSRRLHARYGLAFVAVDYLQLIEPEDRREARREQVEAAANRLKELAKELKIPVLALAQLNREVENRPDPRPRLADLKESGGIEQAADVVILLHRPRDQPDKLELLVRKQRNGPTGDVTLLYRRECFRFEDYLPAAPDNPFS